MNSTSPNLPREFAVQVAQQLRDAGFQALWAGGCVRDQLLGVVPKDYDVATNALPEEVRRVFGNKKTLAVGAAFGVIVVLGPTRKHGQVEVATFRSDGNYLDGRRPESVVFSTAEEDAQRRDFTINGMFYDPLAEKVIDYVDGQKDLGLGVIRAIGNPEARFAEDKLRMLRAVRFAATFDFELEARTRAAVQQHASAMCVVSSERIAAELRRALIHPNRATAMQLLAETNLLPLVLPPLADLPLEPERWQHTLNVLAALKQPSFTSALAACLTDWEPKEAVAHALQLGSSLRLSNEESKGAAWMLSVLPLVLAGEQSYWPKLQRVLIEERSDELLTLAAAVAEAANVAKRKAMLAGVEFCQKKLALPADELNPQPWLSGNDLMQLGIPSGPHFKRILEQLRDEQLLGNLASAEAAEAAAVKLWKSLS
jgi:poly(A) polymerase